MNIFKEALVIGAVVAGSVVATQAQTAPTGDVSPKPERKEMKGDGEARARQQVDEHDVYFKINPDGSISTVPREEPHDGIIRPMEEGDHKQTGAGRLLQKFGKAVRGF